MGVAPTSHTATASNIAPVYILSDVSLGLTQNYNLAVIELMFMRDLPQSFKLRPASLVYLIYGM